MRRKHFSGCVACLTSLWDRKHTKLNRNTQEMCESDSSALLGCKVRWAHPGHCREKLMQEVSALTELGVIQWQSDFLALPFPACFSFWALSQTLLFLSLKDDDTLTKSRLCPGIWTCGIDSTLMGQRSVSFAVSLPGRQAVFVPQTCTGASAVFKLSLGPWEPSWEWLLRDCSELLHPFLPGACSIPAPLLQCLNCDGWYSFRPRLTRGSETGILRLKEEITANLFEKRAKFE